MRHTLAALAFTLLAGTAIAQPFPNQPPGQAPATAGINVGSFQSNSDAIGFSEDAVNPLVVAAGTTQATATLLTARTNVITTCAATNGIQLPAVNHYVPISVLNRSGNTCIVYPTLGATVESAPGTAGAVNAGITMASNVDLIFRPMVSAAGVVSWVQ